jgi:hypothetical protein
MAEPSPIWGALDAAYEEMLALCDGLEAVADALPGPLDTALCQRLMARLVPALNTLQEHEARAMFETVLSSDIEAVRRRLKAHLADSAAAAEVTDALRALLGGETRPSPDALGYLLRAFFDTMRRHVATEREWLRLLAAQSGKIAK